MILKKNDLVILNNIMIAKKFYQRLFGLLFKKKIDDNFGLLFPKSISMHTFFMNIDIDIIFFDKNYKIIGLYNSIKPFRITGIFIKSLFGFVLETKSGFIKKYNLKLGEKIDFIN